MWVFYPMSYAVRDGFTLKDKSIIVRDMSHFYYDYSGIVAEEIEWFTLKINKTESLVWQAKVDKNGIFCNISFSFSNMTHSFSNITYSIINITYLLSNITNLI